VDVNNNFGLLFWAYPGKLIQNKLLAGTSTRLNRYYLPEDKTENALYVSPTVILYKTYKMKD